MFSGIPARITADIGTTGGLALDSTLLDVLADLDKFQFASGRLVVDASGTTIPISAVSLPLPTGAATAANQGTEIASLASIDGKLAPLGQALMAGSSPVVIASDQSPIKTDIAFGTPSVGNSTIATLTAGTSFTGVWENVTDYAIIAFSLFSDQASAVGGLSTQWSSDGANADVVDNSDVTASAGRAFSLSVRAKFFRIVYTNGVVNQTTFRLATIYHKTGTGLISRPMTQNLTDNNYAQTVRSAANAKLPSGSYKAMSMGQTVMADALSVVIASDQTPLAVSLSGAAINIDQWGGVATTLGQKLMAASVPVVLASDEVVPISAASLPLPTGAATDANQATANVSLASIDGKLGSLGQKPMSGSAPVVLASDQTGIQPNTDLLTIGTITALNGAVQHTTHGCGSCLISIGGTWVASLQIQGLSPDGATWTNLAVALAGAGTGTFSSAVITANGTYRCATAGGFLAIRVIATAFTSGTVNVATNTASASATIGVIALNPANLTVNQAGVFYTAQGVMFSHASDQFNLATAAADNNIFWINNPAGSGKTVYVQVMALGISTANRSAVFGVWANPTVTVNGTVATPVNNLVGSGTASVTTTFTAPTTSASGSRLRAFVLPQNSPPVIARPDGTIQVPANNRLLITGNPSANNTLAGFSITWYEVTA